MQVVMDSLMFGFWMEDVSCSILDAVLCSEVLLLITLNAHLGKPTFSADSSTSPALPALLTTSVAACLDCTVHPLYPDAASPVFQA